MEEAKAAEETAKDNEGKAMEAADKDDDRKKKAYQTAYWGHMKDQATETQRIKDLRERPDGAKNPNESHVPNSGSSEGEHWTSTMPEHIFDNKEGPSAKWDTPAPAVKATSTEPAAAGK